MPLGACARAWRQGACTLVLAAAPHLPRLTLRARDAEAADLWCACIGALASGAPLPPPAVAAAAAAVRSEPPATDEDVRALLERANAPPPIRVELRAGGKGALCAGDIALPAPWLSEVLGWLDPPVPESIVRTAASAAAFFASPHAWAWA